jgi:hypothetical protein
MMIWNRFQNAETGKLVAAPSWISAQLHEAAPCLFPLSGGAWLRFRIIAVPT